ncbi:DUF368 domain-containing protein [Corynebacterium sp. A21]|uniref:DUF368 domain-containing protein n=1 Tax=Corynebacterium sp. A21 TaxID=3457318 RepID=UPI003FD2C177
MTPIPQHVYPRRARNTPLSIIFNLLRGALIGMAELVPGISGGTVALVVGIYERALGTGNALIDLVKVALKDRTKLGAAMARVDWLFLGAVGVGMVVMVFTMSSILSGFVDGHPEISRALFLGMVAMSIIVPLGMVDPADLRKKLPLAIPAFIIAAVVTFIGTGFTSAPQENPHLIIIFFAAAVAVCALVLPGISGSFFLLAVGLYGPVMSSLSNREWDVIGVFILGALIGIISFIKGLTWILDNYRTMTLVIMSGLMLGSLRALWPWQDADATLLSPYGTSSEIWTVVGMVVLGGVVVLAVMAIEKFGPKEAVVLEAQDPA